MPLLKHAKKKLRQDKVRTERNKKLKDQFKKLIKEARAKKTSEALSKAFSSIDKATKHYILHKNTAARMKSALSKITEGKGAVAAPAKKAVKKVKGATKKIVSKKSLAKAKK
jgi:small subunit ribosomal protein S20